MTPPPVLCYSVRQAAKALNLSTRTVYRMMRANELAGFRLGGRTMIRQDALQALVDRASGAA